MSMMEHNKKLIQGFVRHFGDMQVSLYAAQGRTELGGNHTDHQNGQVLAAAVDMEIRAAAGKTEADGEVANVDGAGADKGLPAAGGSQVKIYSEGFGRIELDISDLSPREDEKGTAAGLIRGVLAGLKVQGFRTGGFKAYIMSDIPAGSGLSSSAAFEVLIGRIVSGLYNNDSVSYVELAQIGQFAENEYFGKPCGLMDQLACASGRIIYIDFAYEDCPIIEEVDFDFEDHGYKLCITDTGGSHADLTDEYAAVTAEMGAVAELFSGGSCGQNEGETCRGRKLRGITVEQLISRAPEIRQKAGDRALLRALHFAGETERARAEAEALKDGDMDGFLRLVKESGDSSYKLLQNIYPSDAGESRVSSGSEYGTVDKSGTQSLAVALAVSEAVLGEDGVCRVHGGGFAGTIQAFVKNEAVDRYKAAMDKLFGDGACRVMKIGEQND